MALSCTPLLICPSTHTHVCFDTTHLLLMNTTFFFFFWSYYCPLNFLIHFSVFSFSFVSDCLLACFFCFFAVSLEENASKSEESPPEKTVVKERILEKIDLSKGISFRWLHVDSLVLFNGFEQWCTFRYLRLLRSKLLAKALLCVNVVAVVSVAASCIQLAT